MINQQLDFFLFHKALYIALSTTFWNAYTYNELLDLMSNKN